MIALLKVHFYLSRKLLITVFLFIAMMIAMQWLISNEINLGFLAFYLLMFSPSLGSSYILENHFMKRLRIMPIDPKDFVKSLFIFSLLLLLIIAVPIGIYQTYLYLNDQIGGFQFSLISIAFAAGVASIGSMLKNYLSNPTKGSTRISFSILIGYFFLFIFVHLLSMLLFSIIGIKQIGAPIVIIISFIIYYQYFKSAATKYLAAEF